MLHDLILAGLFLAMIIAPSLLTIGSDKKEKDSL